MPSTSPSHQPSASPTIRESTPAPSPSNTDNESSITVISSGNEIVLNITTIDDTRGRRRLNQVVTNTTIQVLEETIENVAAESLAEGQSVKDVNVTNTTLLDDEEQLKVVYDLVLSELCGNIACTELVEISTLYNDTIRFMAEQIDNGNFTIELQENVEEAECGDDDCSILQGAAVVDGDFDTDPVTEIGSTSVPTASPNNIPSTPKPTWPR